MALGEAPTLRDFGVTLLNLAALVWFFGVLAEVIWLGWSKSTLGPVATPVFLLVTVAFGVRGYRLYYKQRDA